MCFIPEEFAKEFALKKGAGGSPEENQPRKKRFLEEVIDAFQIEKPTSRTEIQHQNSRPPAAAATPGMANANASEDGLATL